jgi:actin-related protein 6
VVDSGFSFTYGVPFLNGMPMKYAATRIDVGGKLLTNYLTELLSYKEVNMQGETYIVNEIKESLCYVSTRFGEDLDIC